jgi:carbonic anhydrase
VDAIIAEARTSGYQRMRLDTIASSMQDAIALYRRIGFREIPPYRSNPIEGALYMELVLQPDYGGDFVPAPSTG